MNVKYAFIAGEEGNYPVRKMVAWAKVSRSGYYEWKTRTPCSTARWRAEVGEIVEFLFADSDSTYGYRRLHAALARAGRHVDPQTVRSIMAERGLVACQPRPRGPRTTIGSDAGSTPDLIGRDFTATEPGHRLVGDITYIATWQGWLYLATVLDCFSKKVVGYAMAEHMRTELVTDALAMANRNGHIRPGVTIFHSDRGTPSTRLRISRSSPAPRVSLDPSGARAFVTTMPGRNPSMPRSRSSASTAQLTRLVATRHATLPGTSSCATIGNDSTRPWGTGPQTRSKTPGTSHRPPDKNQQTAGPKSIIQPSRPVTFTAVSTTTGISRSTLYRNQALRALVEHHKHAPDGPITAITDEIATLRAAVNTLADRVRTHDEQLRRLTHS